MSDSGAVDNGSGQYGGNTAPPNGRVITVVGAVLVDNDSRRVLAAQRGPGMSQPGFWEFPGGKVEPHESPRAALSREIEEELGCECSVVAHITTTTYDYPFGRVVLSTWWCVIDRGVPAAGEHAQLRWVDADQLCALPFCPADEDTVTIVARCLAAGVVPSSHPE